MLFVINGFKIGDDAPEASLVKQDGSAYKLSENKGKPYMIVFYASWNPYIAEGTMPVLKEVVMKRTKNAKAFHDKCENSDSASFYLLKHPNSIK
ncbi:TlpA family protein disulfide reductase [Chryseobacterium indoltheticum]|uniref:TlpA family protein disulfide reductase n=1 Tax=Chryseobacterium indoltheticum TaxID=254 RepID=UPI003F4995F8